MSKKQRNASDGSDKEDLERRPAQPQSQVVDLVRVITSSQKVLGVTSAATNPSGVEKPCVKCKHHDEVNGQHACFQEGLRDLINGGRVGRECGFMRTVGACGPSAQRFERAE